MASVTDWATVEFFKREEWVKDPDHVSPKLVYAIDAMRKAAGVPIVIHEAWGPDGHVDGSVHFIGLAVDFHFVGWSLLDQWLFAERFPWQGIGVYPYWSNPGLHVDLRTLGSEHPNMGKRWWRDAKGRYRSIDRVLLGILLAGTK